MTVAELYQWVAVRNWGECRRNQLTQMLMKMFANRWHMQPRIWQIVVSPLRYEIAS